MALCGSGNIILNVYVFSRGFPVKIHHSKVKKQVVPLLYAHRFFTERSWRPGCQDFPVKIRTLFLTVQHHAVIAFGRYPCVPPIS